MSNKIIAEVCTSGMIREMIDNMRVSPIDADDLEQEIYMILLEYDKNKIVELYNKKQLRYFIVGIIQRQYNSKTSPFYKKYKKYYSIVDANVINNEEVTEDDYNYQFED